MDNEGLRSKYDEMHSQGPSSWFSDGQEERELILKMGKPWKNLKVLEIGCGEGDLNVSIRYKGAKAIGIDFSSKAIEIAKEKHAPLAGFYCSDYRDLTYKDFDRLVLQGVLEHLDEPFQELKWMMDNLLTEKGDVITSSPCFLNPRGIVWMTLNMLGAVMSKTDLHFLNPWEFINFAKQNDFNIQFISCDHSWGWHTPMIDDFKKRIPLALKDGNISYQEYKFNKFMEWLETQANYMQGIEGYEEHFFGATMVYHIKK